MLKSSSPTPRTSRMEMGLCTIVQEKRLKASLPCCGCWSVPLQCVSLITLCPFGKRVEAIRGPFFVREVVSRPETTAAALATAWLGCIGG